MYVESSGALRTPEKKRMMKNGTDADVRTYAYKEKRQREGNLGLLLDLPLKPQSVICVTYAAAHLLITLRKASFLSHLENCRLHMNALG